MGTFALIMLYFIPLRSVVVNAFSSFLNLNAYISSLCEDSEVLECLIKVFGRSLTW